MAAQTAARWLLDTNIVSELAREQVNTGVQQTFQAHSTTCAIAAAVWHELQFGLQRLPAGKRQRHLRLLIEQVVHSLPILPYDAGSAELHARLRAQAATQGRTLSEPDAHIASIALQYQLTLVTRNTRDFEIIPGLRLANWFSP